MSNPIEPNHYKLPNGLQVFDLIEDWGLGFHGGNVLKYVLRAGVKDPEKYNEDLDKALEYVKRMAEKGISARQGNTNNAITPDLLIAIESKHMMFVNYLLFDRREQLISEIEKLKKWTI